LHRRGRHAGRLLARYDGQDLTALVIQQPNFFGHLEDVDALTDWAHARAILVIAVVNPTSLALLKPPGEWGERGADIAVGEGQPLGVPLSSGGPYFGFMATRMDYVRQMPGASSDARSMSPGTQASPSPAGARAAYPPRQGDFQHLHQPGTAGDGGHHLYVADGSAGTGAHRSRRARARPASSWQA